MSLDDVNDLRCCTLLILANIYPRNILLNTCNTSKCKKIYGCTFMFNVHIHLNTFFVACTMADMTVSILMHPL